MIFKISFIISFLIHVTIIVIFTSSEKSLVETKISIMKINVISSKVEKVDKNLVNRNKISKEKKS